MSDTGELAPCHCMCHASPGVFHVVACCSAPSYDMLHPEIPGEDDKEE